MIRPNQATSANRPSDKDGDEPSRREAASREERRHPGAGVHTTSSQLQSDSDSPGNLHGVIQRNIHDIIAARRRIESRQTMSERVAGAITRAAGNMWFAYLHVVWFGGWVVFNVFGPAFDPFPFVLLTTVVSLEAIFLTLMVLVSQNREAKVSEQRADLDLQIDLLAEHEVTRLLTLVTAIARRVGADGDVNEETQDLEQEVRPRDLIDELENSEPREGASKSEADVD